MKPTKTIKLYICEICEALCGPTAGKFVRIRFKDIPTQKAEKMWLCNECIEEVRKAHNESV